MKNNKKGAGLTFPTILLIVGLLVAAYLFVPGVKEFFQPSAPTPQEAVSLCPSSGLTTVTLNTQEALASTATNAVTDYYIFEKDGTFVSTGSSGSDGQSSFDLKCGKVYDAIVLNETVTTGSYAQKFEIDAKESTFTKNLKMYEYGSVNLVSVASDVDPLGNSNVSSGAGKSCGFVITFTENESISAFNKPIIMCQTNTTSVDYVTMSGVQDAMSIIPSRKTVNVTGSEWTAYYLDKMLLSTEGAVKVSGKIKYLDSITPSESDFMACSIVDQAIFHKSDYQTMSLNDGFVEAAENTQTKAEIGAPDSNKALLHYNGGYC